MFSDVAQTPEEQYRRNSEDRELARQQIETDKQRRRANRSRNLPRHLLADRDRFLDFIEDHGRVIPVQIFKWFVQGDAAGLRAWSDENGVALENPEELVAWFMTTEAPKLVKKNGFYEVEVSECP